MYDNYYDLSSTPFDFDDYGLSSALTDSSVGSDASTALGGILAFAVLFYLFIIAICGIFAIIKYIGAWKMYKKAGLDGWEALIPIHNIVMEFKLAGLKTYWYFLLLVPIANIIVTCWKDIELAKAYGKSTAFGVGLFLLNPIFTAILGMGKSEYIGPQSAGASPVTPNNSTSVTHSTVKPQPNQTQNIEPQVIEQPNSDSIQPVQESLFDNVTNVTEEQTKVEDNSDNTN